MLQDKENVSLNAHFQFSQNQLEYIDNNTKIFEVIYQCKVFVNGQSTSIISINNEYKRDLK